VHVAGCDHAPGGRDPDLRLGEILAPEAGGIEHGARWRILNAVNDE
jgi:hypothetical protein